MLKYLFAIIIISIPIFTFAENRDIKIKLKDGSEERCMSSISNDEFTHTNYIGDYYFEENNCIRIEDSPDRNGNLILHADCLGLHCPLYRFSKYIYVYGGNPEFSEPILGSVTFLSDGSHINQLILQHDSKQAFFPRKQ